MTKYDIASSMNGIINSPSYQAVFTKPQFSKTAAKKDKEDEKKTKDKSEKTDEKGKTDKKEDKSKDKEKGKSEKSDPKKNDKSDVKDGKKEKEKCKEKDKKGKPCKKASQYQACVMGLAKISELLDDVGLEKEATYTLLALNGLVKSAQYTVTDDGDNSIVEFDSKKPDVIHSYPDELMPYENAENINFNSIKPDIITMKNKFNDTDNIDDEDCDSNDIFTIPATKGDKGGMEEALETLELEEPMEFPLGEQWLAELDEEALDPKNSPMAKMMKLLKEKKEKDKEKEEEESFLKPDEESEYEDEDEDFESTAGLKFNSLQKLAKELKKDPKAAIRNKPDAIFGDKHPKVKDDKDHFPIDTAGRARNALAQVQKYTSAPSWWKGSLEELKNSVSKAVKKKYPSIDVGGKDKKKD